MEKQHILKEQWTVLPSDERIALRKKYDLRITESTSVIDDRVVSDGVSQVSLLEAKVEASPKKPRTKKTK